ncbi:hypothetical protein ASZ78_001192, partial [Callipepla squamata]
EAREKLRRSIFRQVNTCNALLHQVRQRIRARDALRQQLQQLLDVARVAGKRHQQQVQRIRQLENSVEKTRLKIHAGQKVTALYLALRDALKTELRSLPTHVEMLHTVAGAYDREAQHRELMAADASAMASAMDEKDVARLKARMLAEEKELRRRCLAAQKAKGDWLWHKKAERRQPRAVKAWMLWATLPALTDTLRQLELKRAGLKFRQPPGASSCRKLEAELRVRLQHEEARLEQARGSYLRQHELLSLLEMAIDNLVA